MFFERSNEIVHADHLKNSEKGQQIEPGSNHLLHRRFVVQRTPNARGFVALLFLLIALLPRHLVSYQSVQSVHPLSSTIAAALSALPHLVVWEIIIGAVQISGIISSSLDLHLKLSLCFVTLSWQKGELRNANGTWHDKEGEKEVLRLEGAVGGLVCQSVEQENCSRSIKGSSNSGHDQACIFGEGVCDLKRRQENKSTAQSQEEISNSVAVKAGELKSKAHENTAGSKAKAAQEHA